MPRSELASAVSSGSNALLRRGWQHDSRQPLNPARPGTRPQKVPLGLLERGF
jgi:hypothetical protein